MATVKVTLYPGDTLEVTYAVDDPTQLRPKEVSPSWMDYLDTMIKKAGKVPIHEDPDVKVNYCQTDFHQPV